MLCTFYQPCSLSAGEIIMKVISYSYNVFNVVLCAHGCHTVNFLNQLGMKLNLVNNFLYH